MLRNLWQVINEDGEDLDWEISEDGKKAKCGMCGGMRPIFTLMDFRQATLALKNYRPFGFIADCCRTRIMRPVDNVRARRAKRRGEKLAVEDKAVEEHVMVYCMGDKIKGRAMKRVKQEKASAAQQSEV